MRKWQPQLQLPKYVYFFGGGKADGNGKMKDDLGGKGAGLAEMTNAGLPVPPGFTIQTEACREYMRREGVSTEVDRQMDEALKQAGRTAGPETGQRGQSAAGERSLGRKVFHARHDGHDSESWLERSERGSAGEAQQQSRALPYDSYRRLIQMFGNVVLEIPKARV